MLIWGVVILVGALAAYLSYGASRTSYKSPTFIAPLLRAAAISLLVAALLNAPLGIAGRPAALVLLDVSASWTRGGDTTAWAAALDAARRSRGDSIVLYGDSARLGSLPDLPADSRSRVLPAVLQALGSGSEVVLITDGEMDDPSTTLDVLPAGSRIVVPARPSFEDVAVASVDIPRYVTTGDSVAIRVSLVAGASGSQAGRLSLYWHDRVLATEQFPALSPYGEQLISMNGLWDVTEEGSQRVSVVVSASGDREPRNDTLFAGVESSSTPSVVFVSTAPDPDARYALAVLRGTLSLPTRAFFRVAPGNWRLDGPLTRVAEAEVRRAITDAPVVVLHGDTTAFGPPRANTSGALALFSTNTEGGDWYPTGSPPSPISAALSGIPWDSLPPIEVSPNVPAGAWSGLETRRGRQFDSRSVLSAAPGDRRIVVIGASGMWRWSLRGGVAADVFSAFWGSIFDWLVAERADRRAAFPASVYFREGETIRWRKGVGTDSAAQVVVTARVANATPDTLQLHFAGSSLFADSQSLPSGEYDVESEGGTSLLVINSSRELLPRRPALREGSIDGPTTRLDPTGARRSAPVYVAIVILLCLEWLMRRRLGLR